MVKKSREIWIHLPFDAPIDHAEFDEAIERSFRFKEVRRADANSILIIFEKPIQMGLAF